MKGGDIRAAGGVLWRSRGPGYSDAAVEIAVVHRPRYDDWSLPKGKVDPGESDFEAALREVQEETGHRGRPGRSLGAVRYLKTSGNTVRPKVVRYWEMEADGGAFTPDDEVDEVRWVEAGSAHSMLTHPTDREVLGRFISQPTRTGLILLVRHASAGQRSKWKGDDRLRPLDDKGVEQAKELVRSLKPFDISAIASADLVRCVDTVAPLSRAVGVPVEEEPLLSERDYPGREEEAIESLRALERRSGRAVACSQGDVIPDLLHRLTLADRASLPADLGTRKGGVWVLSFCNSRLCWLERHPPEL